MDEDPGAAIAQFFADLDPEALLRSIALALAESRCDKSKNHEQVMAVAGAYFEFIDPFAMEDVVPEWKPDPKLIAKKP